MRTIHEIRLYQDESYLPAQEAAIRLFRFPIIEGLSAIDRLKVHLEARHNVWFGEGEQHKLKAQEKTNQPS